MTWIDDYEAGIGLARDEEGEYMYVFAVGPEPGDEADEWGFPKYWSHKEYAGWAKEWWPYPKCSECYEIKQTCLQCVKLALVRRASKEQVEQ